MVSNKQQEELEKKITSLTEELKKTRDLLVRSEKMAALGTLVAEVAHEINNPTNFVYGITHNLNNNISELKNFIFELAGEEADENFKQMFETHFHSIERNLNDIGEGSQRIKTIIQDLRTFSRLDEEEAKKADITEGINSTLRLIKAKYKNDVEFKCDFQVRKQIDCWPAQLNQVFMNIMVNACQAIQAKQNRNSNNEAGNLNIKTYMHNNELAVEFTDDGCGMTEEVKNRMFEPFFTTKDAGSGTGIGMSITYGIIEKHHGRIKVESELDKGTTLTIFFPVNHVPSGKQI